MASQKYLEIKIRIKSRIGSKQPAEDEKTSREDCPGNEKFDQMSLEKNETKDDFFRSLLNF